MNAGLFLSVFVPEVYHLLVPLLRNLSLDSSQMFFWTIILIESKKNISYCTSPPFLWILMTVHEQKRGLFSSPTILKRQKASPPIPKAPEDKTT